MFRDDLDIPVRLYRGTALIIFFIFLIGVNIRGWKSVGCDYIQIFQLDKNAPLTEYHLFGLAAIFGSMWAISVLGYLYADLLELEPYLMPLLLVTCIILFIFNPTDTFNRPARCWFLRTVCRIILAPFFQVEFADFWLADQLMSMVQVLLDFKYCICFYSTKLFVGFWPGLAGCECMDPGWWVAGVVAALPAWFRIQQCLRKYRDAGVWFPDLANALKYLASLVVVVLTTLKTNHGKNLSEGCLINYFWLGCTILSSLYSLTWDVKMDWKLLQIGSNTLLRRNILYNRFCYYLALVMDVVLRFGWLISLGLHRLLSPGSFSPELCVTLFSVLEIFRRFVWNFFRLEVEQLANYQKLHSSLLAVEVDSSSSSSVNHSGDSSSSEDDEISVRQLRRHSELLHQHEQLLEVQRQRLKEEQQIRQHRISAALGIFRKSSILSTSSQRSSPNHSTPLLHEERPTILGSSYGACTPVRPGL